MTDSHRQRLLDIQAAIEAIRAHLMRGDLSDEMVFDAVRIRLLEIGEAVKALPARLLATEPSYRGRRSLGCVIILHIVTSTRHTRSCRPLLIMTDQTWNAPSPRYWMVSRGASRLRLSDL